MIKLKDILLEGINHLNIAKTLVKYYKLNSKIKIVSSSNNKADYIPEKDLMQIAKTSNKADYIVTVLHEIKHALDAKSLGVKKFIKKYGQAGTMAGYHGLDPHDDNRWEVRAEKWAQHQFKTIWKHKINDLV